METIKDIKTKLSLASDEELLLLIPKYATDNRSGVQNVVASAKKRLVKAEEERIRVHNLYKFQDDFAEHRLLMGLDEVGRGPLAGPLTVAAVVLPQSPEILGINDSKQLSARKREELAVQIKETALAYSIQHIPPADIDAYGMSACLRRAFKQAIDDIDAQLPDVETILLDGNPLRIDRREKNIVKGDARCASISCASIIAKVARDSLMAKYAKEYPEYHWDGNSGYGSTEHIAMIKGKGLTPYHRKSFCKNFMN